MAKIGLALGGGGAKGFAHVPILEALNIAKETSGNAMFERMYGKVIEEIREGATISEPMKANAKPGFHPVAAGLWVLVFAGPVIPLIFLPAAAAFAMPVILAGGLYAGNVAEAIQAVGGRIILMASRALARVAAGPEDYTRLYAEVLAAADRPEAERFPDCRQRSSP